MNPYQAYMEKSAGLLRAHFLSGNPMSPEHAQQWEAVTQRFAQRQMNKEGVPFTKEDGTHHVIARMAQLNGGKSVSFSAIPHADGDKRGLSLFSAMQRPGQPMQGRTHMQEVDQPYQRQGYGSRVSRAMDTTMSAMGARTLHTDIENKDHVTGYRTRAGYEPTGNGMEHAKDVMTTPAIHRDRQRFATPEMERVVTPAPGSQGRGAPGALQPLQNQPVLRPVAQPATV